MAAAKFTGDAMLKARLLSQNARRSLRKTCTARLHVLMTASAFGLESALQILADRSRHKLSGITS